MASPGADIVGHWKFDRQDNFDKYFDYLGSNVNFLLRQVVKVAKKSKPDKHVVQEGNRIIIDLNMGFRTQHEDILTDGTPYEKDDNGYKFECVAVFEGNKLIVTQTPKEKTGNWKTVVFTRQIVDGEYYLHMTIGEGDEQIVCKRWFKRDETK